LNKYKKYLNKAVNICVLYGFDITLSDVISKYSEPHRFWHTVEHLYKLLDGINELYENKKINQTDFNYLNISTIFHDIVYDTRKNDNEEKSVKYMLSKYNNIINDDVKIIIDIILSTKTHISNNKLCQKFIKLDTQILDSQFIDMLDWENKIYEEYKWVGLKIYKKKRVEFLLGSIKKHKDNEMNIKKLIDYVRIKYV
jgi:predicted metal-dependent HD superfamily phosphohydrolase